MAEKVDTKQKTFVASAAITQHALVTLSSGKVAEAAITEMPIGTANVAVFADDDLVPVDLLSGGGTIKCIAAADIVQGAYVYGQNGGEVLDDSSGSALAVGVALDTATAADDIIEVLPYVAHT